MNCTTGQLRASAAPEACQGVINNDEDFRSRRELSADYRADNFNMGLSYARARSKGEDTGYCSSVSGGGSESGDKYMVNLGLLNQHHQLGAVLMSPM